MGEIKIRSLNVGMPRVIPFQRKDVNTGIFKDPTEASIFLSYNNLDGDGQGDLVHHGGKEKAVCVYPYEHYAFWEEALRRQLSCGALGENVTTQGLLETEVCIGDKFRLGEAIVEVSQPRQPCYKLTLRYGVPEMVLKVQQTGYTGFYFRVLQEGHVSRDAGISLLERHQAGITIAYANRMMHQDKDDLEGVRRIIAVAELSDNWRRTFMKRLAGSEPDTRERLTGQT